MSTYTVPGLMTVPVAEAAQHDTAPEIVRLFYRFHRMPVFVTRGKPSSHRNQQVYSFLRVINEDGPTILMHEVFLGSNGHLYFGDIFRFNMEARDEPELIRTMGCMPAPPTNYRDEQLNLSSLTSYALDQLRCGLVDNANDAVELAIVNAAMAGILNWGQLAKDMRANSGDTRLRQEETPRLITWLGFEDKVAVLAETGLPATSNYVDALHAVLVAFVRAHL